MTTRFQDADGNVVELEAVHAVIDHTGIAGGSGPLSASEESGNVDITPDDLGKTFFGTSASLQGATLTGTFPDGWWCRFVQAGVGSWKVDFPSVQSFLLNGVNYFAPPYSLHSAELGFSWTVMKLSGKWYLEPQGSELSAQIDPGGGE